MAVLIRSLLSQSTPSLAALSRGITTASSSTPVAAAGPGILTLLKCSTSNDKHLKESRPSISRHLCKSEDQRPTEYKLPTLHKQYKVTILDPLASQREYKLPTMFSVVKEKFTPSHERIVPIEDPNPLQKIIDQGAPKLEKRAAWLMKVRHKMMKKHQLKKYRKRMLFTHRKMNAIKKKKKEKRLVAYERSQVREAQELDVEKFAEEQIKLAKEGGWKVDMFKQYKNTQSP